MSNRIKILTAPVRDDLQRQVRQLAKSNGIPVSRFCGMLIEHGVNWIKTGKLTIAGPELKPEGEQ